MTKILLALGLLVMVSVAYGHGGGGNQPSVSGPDRHQKSDERVALEYYRSGNEIIDVARALEQKADNAESDKRKVKYSKKAQKQYRKAVKKFALAQKYEPMLYQAHSSLGFALSKTGDHERALLAHNRALEIRPRDPEVMARWGVTVLNLGRLSEAQTVYTHLSKRDRDQASYLLGEMLRWKRSRVTEVGVPGEENTQAFDRWLASQSG